MAKSKSGGTRSYLRGRIASDVYSIGRDASGKKQQVVRSLAEQVKNPQTISQMRGRMIMSTVMQAVSAMSQIIDHSFDNVPNGQPSISEFIRRNYQLIKDDVAAHPASNNVFGLNKYQEKGMMLGAYLIADGKAVLPSAISATGLEIGSIGITYDGTSITFGELKSVLGMADGDFLTLCRVFGAGTFTFIRFNLSTSLADSTVLTSENLSSAFVVDNPFGEVIDWDVIPGEVQIMPSATDCYGGAVILSKKVDSGYEHSTTVLTIAGTRNYTADVALPTYPVGEERFLNGGEL